MIDLQWLVDVFLKYLDEWEQEVVSIPGIEKKDQRRMCLSLETLEGMKISGLAHKFQELNFLSRLDHGLQWIQAKIFGHTDMHSCRHGGAGSPSATKT